MRAISEFQGEYRFLSNFYPCDITIVGVDYKSVEAAYQASKSCFISKRKEFSNLEPGAAKKLGRTIELHKYWDDVAKITQMELCLRAKFNIPGLRRRLISTSPLTLEEGNNWGDQFWGISRGKGRNVLGKLLMIIRDELILYEPQMLTPKEAADLTTSDDIPF